MTIYDGMKKILPNELPGSRDGGLVCLAGAQERQQALALFSLKAPPEPSDGEGTRFESRHGHDYLFFQVPNMEDLLGEPQNLELYFSGALLLVVGSGPKAILRLAAALDGWDGPALTPARVLQMVVSHLFHGHSAYLEDMEEEIAQMEEQVSQDDLPRDFVRSISQTRRKLLALKRYYEAMYDLLEDMEENQNGLFTPEQLRAMHLHTNQADRFVNKVVNLREYVSQVREGYQNQIDVSLNKTMKLFTVLTAIFFPLTLIAGWYGMNLRMPEYEHAFAYPMVIFLSTLVVVVSVVYFRKKKWF